MKRILLAAALAFLPAAASAQVYLPPGVSLPPQSVIGNTLPVSGNAVAVPFAQFGSSLGVPALKTCPTSQWFNALLSAGVLQCLQPAITDISGLGSGVAAFLGTATSANLRNALTDETGTGSAVFATSPTLVNPNLGTPSAATLTNATGLPIGSGIAGLGTGVASALGVNTGGAGAFVVNGGALGTPSSGVGTNLTSLNASNLSSGTVAAARGGAGTVNGALAGNGSGAVTQAACAGLSDSSVYCPAARGQLPGIATNTAASAGNIGEVISNTVNFSPGTATVSATPLNITSISLTAGEWMVSGSCYANGGTGTTMTLFQCSPSQTSATVDTITGHFTEIPGSYNISGQVFSQLAPTYKVSLASTTTIFLVGQFNYSGGTLTAGGYIQGVRIH